MFNALSFSIIVIWICNLNENEGKTVGRIYGMLHGSKKWGGCEQQHIH